MLGKILNFIRKFSPKPSADSPRKTPGTHPSFTLKGRPNTDPVDALGSIENKQGNRLGFMLGEGRVPDDFNTMGAKEIENLFLNGR
jgi:hypothetical protein